MPETKKAYVEKTPDGGWRIAGSRVSLASIVHAYWEGRLPESIVVDFPSLSLEQVHGAIAFYLGHREEVDKYLAEQEAKWNAFRTESETRHADILKRLRSPAGKGRDDQK